MKKYFFSLLFLFFLGITFGEQYCVDDAFSTSLIVKNHNSFNEYLTVSYSATPGAIVTIKDSMDLGFFIPGQEKVISYDVWLPFKGNYSLTFDIIDSRQNKETKRFDFEVVNCHGIDIEILASDSYCLIESAPYQVIITNTGKYAENLSININGEVFNANVLPGKSRIYDMEFYSVFPQNNKINVFAQNDFINERAEKTVNLRNCHYTGIALDPIKTCQGQLIDSRMTIKNLSPITDGYSILNSSASILIEPRFLFIDPKSEDYVDFSIIPACDELGLKKGEINLFSRNSGHIKAIVSYEVLNCHDFEIVQVNSFSEICEQDEKTLGFILTNRGLVPDSYTGTLKFGNESIILNFYLKEKETAHFNITEYFDYYGKSSAELTIKSNNFCSKKKFIIYNFTVKPFNECYSGNVELQKNFRQSSLIKISNNGSRQNEYFISLYNYSEINNISFSLNPFESREIQLLNLKDIMDDYGISVFSANVFGKGVNVTSQTSYADSITGMIILRAKEYYSYFGIFLLIIVSSFFVKNNLLKLIKR